MKNNKKNSMTATKQVHGINNIFLLQIISCLKLNFKYIFFTILFSILAIYIGETVGKFIACLIWI